jgi:hypothetical protein
VKTDRSLSWLRDAVGGIKYKPDRKRVAKELYEHLIARNEDFLAQGVPEREADELVVKAMGDPDETRRLLAEVYKPFWGNVIRTLRTLVIIALVWAVVALVANRFFFVNMSGYAPREGTVIERTIPQSASVRCGDYRFRVLRASFAKDAEGESCLLVELRATTLDPFLGGPKWYYYQAPVLIDNKGNAGRIGVSPTRELVFTTRWLLCFSGVDEEAEWAMLTIPSPEGPQTVPISLWEASP